MPLFPLNRERRRERLANSNEARMFISKVKSIYDSLYAFQKADFTYRDRIILTNISKDCKRLANMYETDDTFIPERMEDEGYAAEKYFNNHRGNVKQLQFPDVLRFIAYTMEDIAEETETDEQLNYLETYMPLIERFMTHFCMDYKINDILD